MQEKVSSAQGKVSSTQEKVSNPTKDMSNTPKEVSNTFGKYLPLFKEAEITDKFINNIEQVFVECGTGVPFGQVNVKDYLC